MASGSERLAALASGRDPALIARLPAGWAVLGDPQVLEGYCLLLADPLVSHFNTLTSDARSAFWRDLGDLGDAVLAVSGATRVNYAIFGNVDPYLHAHVFPRWSTERAERRTIEPVALDWTSAPRFDPVRHGALQAALRAALSRVRGEG